MTCNHHTGTDGYILGMGIFKTALGYESSIINVLFSWSIGIELHPEFQSLLCKIPCLMTEVKSSFWSFMFSHTKIVYESFIPEKNHDKKKKEYIIKLCNTDLYLDS